MNLISKCILKLKKYPENYFETETLSNTDNVYIVEKDGKFGLLDGDTRKLVMQLQDNQITSYSEGLVGMSKDGKAGYVDLKGKVVVDFKYDKAEGFQSNHLARVEKDGMDGYISRETLEPVIAVKYDYIGLFNEAGYAIVDYRDKCGYVDSNGKFVGGLEFDQIGEISEGLFAARKGTKWGYISLEGKEAIPFKYSKAEAFLNGYAVVKQNGKSGVINKSGEKVIACRYDEVKYVEDEIACVVLDNRIGYVDTHDKTIIPCELLSYVSENDTEYQINLDYIKMVYSKKAAEIKSQAAKDRLIREFNQEMQKMADARVAYCAYRTKRQQKEYRTTQLRQDCVEEISTSNQVVTEEYPAITAMEENDAELAAQEQNVEDVEENDIPPFVPAEEVSDGTEYDEIVNEVPEDELVNNN